MDELIRIESHWQPDPLNANPTLATSDVGPTTIFFRTIVETPSDDPYAVLRFTDCLVSQFGYPNFESLPGHPLFAKGLDQLGLFEVRGSSWIDRLVNQNRSTFPMSWEQAPGLRHFIVTFRDVSFECVAQGGEGRFARNLQDAKFAGESTYQQF